MSTCFASSLPLPPANPGGSAGLDSTHHATAPPPTAAIARETRIIFLGMGVGMGIYPANFDGRAGSICPDFVAITLRSSLQVGEKIDDLGQAESAGVAYPPPDGRLITIQERKPCGASS